MSHSGPLFSIIIPTYNRKNFLKVAVESVFKQTFQDYELIIIDEDLDIDANKTQICFFVEGF